MKRTELSGIWNLKIIGKDSKLTGENGIDVKIPGSVYSALLDKNLIEDPYYGENELKVLPIMDNDFEFTTEFEITQDMLGADGLLLKFDGVDTISEVYVNEELVGTTQNMHVEYEFDLKEVSSLKVGTNELKVLIKSPTRYIKEENAKVYTGGSSECMEGFPHMRKAHCMFGWDWGPRVPDAGIFRNVSLIEVDKARLESVKITQEHYWDPKDVSYAGTNDIPPSKVILHFDIDTELFAKDIDTHVNIMVYSFDGEVYSQGDDEYSVAVSEPQLWWPRGYGEQPLYTVEVILCDEQGNKLDSWTRRIGLRTLTVNTDKDEYGEMFAHEVNGVKIFAMGADYIPEDNILSRVTPERTRKLLEDAVWANHNSIRVWGGGYYLDDYFYDFCDELGLLVWQDFMFACASYELDDAFEKNIVEEATQVVKRLRHHASLALFCGNNEMETQTLDGCWKPSIKQKADYIKIFEYILPKIVKEEAPETFYWPSSPSSCGNFDNPWDENRGDTHYWDVWHGEKPFTAYRDYNFRYLSEFGFQSFPCLDTIKKFADDDELNIFSRTMEMHQRNCSANGKIMKYMSQMYLYPKNFEMLLYASQLLQADAIRYGVEHFRRNRGRCMGTVVWQLNDIWPVASWSSIDYFGKYKALHYAEKRMFAPISISCEETGELTERQFCIMEPKTISKGARLHVANETKVDSFGTVKWSLRNPDSSIICEGDEKVTVPHMGGIWLEYMNFDEYDERQIHLTYSYEVFGRAVSQNSTLFTPPKHYRFMNPNLSYELNNDVITVSADCYAKNVCIEPLDGEAVFDDNYFDMEKGIHQIKITSGNATKFNLKSVWDIA